MADTKVQLQVEDWVRLNWLPKKFDQPFHPESLKLSSGGVFGFDAVSADGKIAVSISTSGAITAGGRRAVGKLMKLRSDMLFLMLANVERRLLVLTERDMFDLCMREKNAGRVPLEIEFACAEIPTELVDYLNAARKVASREVSPQRQ